VDESHQKLAVGGHGLDRLLKLARELCQQTDRGNGIGGVCSGSEPPDKIRDRSGSSVSAANGADSNLDCTGFEPHEEAQRVLKLDPSDPHNLNGDGDGVPYEELQH
jgi:hypothetical protein